MKLSPTPLLGGLAMIGLAAVLAVALHLPPRAAQAQGPVDRQQFQQLLLVPPDDRDYVVVRAQQGQRVVVTDVIAYNAQDGRGHKVAPGAENYVWLGGYVEGKSVGLINRMRLLGNDSEQWRMETGFELRGAAELVVSNEKGTGSATPVLVYVNGYLAR